MKGALEGTIVVALEQAVAAPLASSRLADAGARVIKLERPEGDFARGYDDFVHGQSSYFVWNNRGKESCTRRSQEAGRPRSRRARCSRRPTSSSRTWRPGATDRLGIGSAELRAAAIPRLIVCDIGGYAPGNARPRAQGL